MYIKCAASQSSYHKPFGLHVLYGPHVSQRPLLHMLYLELGRFIMDLGGWLRSLGLERYEGAFRENDIDETVLTNLTAEDLKELGVTAIGHRRKLLDAIAALRADATAGPTAASGAAAVDTPPWDAAERRQVTVMFSDLVGSTALSTTMDA
jgi:hypothetical protein